MKFSGVCPSEHSPRSPSAGPRTTGTGLTSTQEQGNWVTWHRRATNSGIEWNKLDRDSIITVVTSFTCSRTVKSREIEFPTQRSRVNTPSGYSLSSLLNRRRVHRYTFLTENAYRYLASSCLHGLTSCG